MQELIKLLLKISSEKSLLLSIWTSVVSLYSESPESNSIYSVAKSKADSRGGNMYPNNPVATMKGRIQPFKKGGIPTKDKKEGGPTLCPHSNALIVQNLKGGSNPRTPSPWIRHWQCYCCQQIIIQTVNMKIKRCCIIGHQNYCATYGMCKYIKKKTW